MTMTPTFGRSTEPQFHAAPAPFVPTPVYVEPAPARDWADTLVALLFSPQGRISRRQYRLSRIGFAALWFAVAYLIGQARSDSLAAMTTHSGLALALAEIAVVVIVAVIGLTISVVLSIKRWHDLGKSGWWALSGFAPVIGWLWQMIHCNFMTGTPGANAYGDDPQI